MPLVRTLARIGLLGLVLCPALGFTHPPGVDRYRALSGMMVRIIKVATDGDYVSRRNWMNDGIVYEKWPVDGTPDHTSSVPVPSYNQTFASALDGKTIEGFAEERRQMGRSTHIADIMGSAVFSEEPHLFDSLTGVRLRPLYPGAYPEGYPCAHWREVTGNVYTQSTWDALDNVLGENKFDLIVARPEGFITRLSRKHLNCANEVMDEHFFALHFRLVSRLWQRLTAEEGVMVLQLSPEIAAHPKFQKWIDSLARSEIDAKVFMDGIGLRGACPILRLKKNARSPVKLPHTSDKI